MSQIENTVGGVGVVHVGPLAVTVTPLSVAAERALYKKLRAGAAQAAREASLYDGPSVQRLLDSLQKTPALYVEAVRELTRLAVDEDKLRKASGGATDAEFLAYRASPAGVALELFERGRTATPGLDLPALSAVITGVNADEVLEQMTIILEAGVPNSATPST